MVELVLTVEETADVLRTHKNRVYALIKKKELKAMKIGHTKVPVTELEDFISRNIGKDLTDLDNIKDLDVENL